MDTEPRKRLNSMKAPKILTAGAGLGRGFAVAAIFGFLAAASVRSAYSHVLRIGAPDLVVRNGQADGIAFALAADRQLIQNGNAVDLRRIAYLARQGLLLEPLNPAALRILGLVADTRNRPKLATDLLTLSAKISRRDLGAQLWLIDRAAQSGDMQAALAHYDAALRASPESSAVLFPILTSAIEDPEVRTGMAPLMRTQPPWQFTFLSHALSTSPDPASIARLLIATGSLPAKTEFRDIESRMISTLSAQGNFNLARQYMASLKGHQMAAIEDVGLTEATTDARFRPLTWEPTSGAALGAAFERESRVARVFSNPGERGTVLRRVLFLPQGGYAVRVDEEPVASDATSEHWWQVSCSFGKDVNVTWRSDVLTSSRTMNVKAEFRVPQNCQSQIIELNLAGGLGQNGLEFLVKNIAVTKISTPGLGSFKKNL
jgi:tetratricopeptide (TPR) repeat protein